MKKKITKVGQVFPKNDKIPLAIEIPTFFYKILLYTYIYMRGFQSFWTISNSYLVRNIIAKVEMAFGKMNNMIYLYVISKV